MARKREAFCLADNEKIGKHLHKLISKRYDSVRQFGRAFLILRDKKEPDSEELQKMSNRLSQIKQGKKAIQLADLPLFTHLLDVSAEEILTAGQHAVPLDDRYTNYRFAASHDRKYWEEYIKRDDKIILETDEYGKTILDYAEDFGNYELLKYLMDQGYIWFVGEEKESWSSAFGAGTSIKRAPVSFKRSLSVSLADDDHLRMRLIMLAIKNGGFEMLDELRARELPFLALDCRANADIKMAYEDELECIADLVSETDDDRMVAYFLREFNSGRTKDLQDPFLFPGIERMAEKMMEKKHPMTDRVLDACLAHNQKIAGKIDESCRRVIKYNVDQLGQPEKLARENVLHDLGHYMELDEKHHLILILVFSNALFTNLVHLKKIGQNSLYTDKIAQINAIYDQIVSLREKD